MPHQSARWRPAVGQAPVGGTLNQRIAARLAELAAKRRNYALNTRSGHGDEDKPAARRAVPQPFPASPGGTTDLGT